ncbi:estradiol 17-beta-dehydrogenase 2 isoform X2 [Meleagris gallopavo]|uniref:estradiol 17-beta-dehydrogenase 2 isoform X2 n=1 Tax=Meleagris gallopavo TaxID=9103 RepID=UPI00093E3443|nr:estradiol 17-beta-dehydrogenase 2 isoform X2 [Meleagris gallopavo]
MDVLPSSALGWLCVAIPVLFGLCLAKRRYKAHVLLQIVLPALLGLLCVAVLGTCWGLIVFCSTWLSCLVYLDAGPLPVGDKAVLITGSDTGIGHALAKYLDNLGFTVFAGVLNKDGPGAEELRRTCSQRLSLLQLDITNPTQVKEAYLQVSEKVQNTGLWGVVNNAGILGFLADGELLPMNMYRQCMEVNFFGAVEVSKTFLPLLRKSQGRLVNMSSMAGGIPLPRYAAYGASKAALSMFSGVMRQELSKWGIKVAAIHPSGFRTGFYLQESAVLLPDCWMGTSPVKTSPSVGAVNIYLKISLHLQCLIHALCNKCIGKQLLSFLHDENNFFNLIQASFFMKQLIKIPVPLMREALGQPDLILPILVCLSSFNEISY